MKELLRNAFLLALLLTGAHQIYAQAPEGINYQAVARDAGGQILENQGLTVRLTIKENGPAGSNSYQETHNVTTNDFGLFSLTIGQGNPTIGTFNNIGWGSASHFLKVEVDDGSGFTNLGTTQFVSVPYALYAKEAGKGGGTSYNAGAGIDISGNTITNTGDTDASDDLTNSSNAGGDASGNFSNLTVIGLQGKPVSTASPSQNQVLKWNGSQWAPANDVGGGAGDNWGSQTVQTNATLTGNGTAGNVLGLAPQGAGNGQVLKWNGSQWVPGNDANTTYSAGSGLSLSGTTFSNTGDVNASDDITNSTSAGGDLGGTYPNPSVQKIQGRTISSTTPVNGEVLTWDGSQWVPASSNKGLWSQSGSDIYYESGNVGIGTTSPAYKLHIKDGDFLMEDLTPFLYLNSTIGHNSGLTMETNGQKRGWLYFNGNNNDLILSNSSNGSTNQVVLDTNGNLGIGAADPAAKLHVKGREITLDGTNDFINIKNASASSTSGLRFYADGSFKGALFYQGTNDVLNLSRGVYQDGITIDNSGNIGIGTHTPVAPIHAQVDSTDFILESNRAEIRFRSQPTCGGDIPKLLVQRYENSYNCNEIKVMPGDFYGIGVTGDIGSSNLKWDNIYSFRFYASPYSSGGYQTYSDRRIKENIQPISSPIKKIMAINGVTYDITEAYQKKHGHEYAPEERFNQIGVIAQDVEKVFPQLVQTNEEGLKSVGYMGLIPVLVEGMKAQQKEIDELKKEIKILKENASK